MWEQEGKQRRGERLDKHAVSYLMARRRRSGASQAHSLHGNTGLTPTSHLTHFVALFTSYARSYHLEQILFFTDEWLQSTREVDDIFSRLDGLKN